MDVSPWASFFFFKELQNWDVLVEQNAVPEYTKGKGSAGSHSGSALCLEKALAAFCVLKGASQIILQKGCTCLHARGQSVKGPHLTPPSNPQQLPV